MIPEYNTSSYTTGNISVNPQQTVQVPESVPNLFGLGFLLIIMILIGRQLVVNLNQRYQLHCMITSLQRRATLERQLQCKSPAPVLEKHSSQRT